MDYRDNLDREVTLRSENAGGSVELGRDFILPDSYADIKKVLGVTAMLSPGGGYADAGKAYYSGEVNCQVMFVTDEGTLVSLACPLSYDAMAVVGNEEGQYDALFMPCIASLSARAVNPRKIGVKARLEPSLYAFEKRDAYVAFEESLTEADIESFEEKTEPFSYLSAKYVSAKGIESGDDITVDEAYLPIGEIVSTDVSFSNVTAEAREDGVAVNGSAEVTVLYRNESGEPVMRRHTLPVSTLAECEGVKEGDAVCVSLYCEGVSCKASENAAGEARVMELDFTYSVEGAALTKESGVAVKDLYSTRYECENSEKELPVANLVGTVDTAVRLSGEMPCEEKGEVLGSFGSITPLSFTKKENGESALEGMLQLTVLLCGEEGNVFSKVLEMPILWHTPYTLEERPEALSTATLNQVKVTLSGDLLSAEATVGLHALVWEVKKEKMIVNTRVTAEVDRGDGSLFTVYFPSSGESVWEIAKKYRVPEDRLLFSQGEAGGGKKRVLILPMPRKAIYRGTIEA